MEPSSYFKWSIKPDDDFLILGGIIFLIVSFSTSTVFFNAGSTVLFNYLANFGNVYHIHDRYPPKKLQYVGKENTN